MAFTPAVTLVAAVAFGAASLFVLGQRARWDRTETATFAGIVAATFGWLLWIARPSFFPLGSGPDLTHHLLLIDYIEAHWRLVHDPGVQEFLGEMVQYTPGSHILTALAGACSRSNGLHALHAVMAASASLKAGFVFLIAMRLLPQDLPRVPIAALASIALFASQTYFLSAFVQYSFLAQVVAELFGVGMLWTLIFWDQENRRWSMALTGLLGAALFLTWPILIGPPLVVLGSLVVFSAVGRGRPSAFAQSASADRRSFSGGWSGRPAMDEVRKKFVDAMIAVVPIAIVAGLFSIGRMDYVVIAGTGGQVVTPSVRAYGWAFLIVSTLGLAVATVDLKVRTKTLALFAGAILLQAGALYLFARSRSNDPYMARKMFYMLLYPQAVCVPVAVGAVWRVLARASHLRQGYGGQETGHYVLKVIPWVMAAGALVFVARPLVGAPRSLSVAKRRATSSELEQAGKWAREHVDPHCVEYLVGDDNTAYWLHLAVLGNPRRGSRTADNATYELTPALVRWLTPDGLPYAIADLRVLPADIKGTANIVAQFGPAAVIKRRGSALCGAG